VIQLTSFSPEFGSGRALVIAWRRTSQHTLRISIVESEEAMGIRLEGRVAGPWAAELSRAWVETASRLASRKIFLDLRDVTYADADGTQVLREIYSQTHAKLLAGTPWTESLAEQITRGNAHTLEEV
jgi:anti-anti-sigma regulatory factor